MPLDPTQFATASAYDLLEAAATGMVGLDHRLLRALVDEPQRTLPDIVRFASEDRSGTRIDLDEDLVNIFSHLKAREGLPFLLDYLRRNIEEPPPALMEAFDAIGEPAIQPLIDLYKEVGEEQGGEVAFVLASMTLGDELILNLLAERLDYDALDALLLLSIHRDPAARPAIEKFLAGIRPDEPGAAELKRESEQALESLAATAEKPEEKEGIWDFYPEESVPYAEILSDDERAALLDSTSAEYRAAVAAYFFNRDLARPVWDKLFLLARQDPAVAVRAQCWRTLGGALEEQAVRETMLAILGDAGAPAEERCGALVGLALEEEPAVRAAMLSFYEDPQTRASALEAMWRSLDRQFSGFFAQHLDDPDLAVRRQAIWGVGYLGIGAEASRLREYFEDDELRTDALFAYALAVPVEFTRGRVRGVLNKIDQAAGGLDREELELVRMALDERLVLHGWKPVFSGGGEESDEELQQYARPEAKVGRNDPCPCGSGKKHKKCCGK